MRRGEEKGMKSEGKEKSKKSDEDFRKRCGNCINFDCGICDFNGLICEDDDPPKCDGRGWRRV